MKIKNLFLLFIATISLCAHAQSGSNYTPLNKPYTVLLMCNLPGSNAVFSMATDLTKTAMNSPDIFPKLIVQYKYCTMPKDDLAIDGKNLQPNNLRFIGIKDGVHYLSYALNDGSAVGLVLNSK